MFNLTIGKKMYGSFALVLLLIIIVGVSSYLIMASIDKKMVVERENIEMQQFFAEKVSDHLAWVMAMYDQIYLGKEFKKQLDPTKCDFGKWYYSFKTEDPEVTEILETLEAPHKDLHGSAALILAQLKSGNKPGAEAIFREKTNDYLTTLRTQLNKMGELLAAREKKARLEADNMRRRGTNLIVAAISASLVIGLLLSFSITRSITRPIRELSESLLRVAIGDLSIDKVKVSTNDEVGVMTGAFNNMLDNMRDMIQKVKHSSVTVAAAARDTSLGNQDLSQRTEEQAASIEEISSTIEEVTASMQQSSVSSENAGHTSRATLGIVQKGENMVNELYDAMQEITKGGHEIAEIIAKVNDIAFQTNLLALNAAVEAARAGEQGRGFAVVAAEVRNLAGRTAESAKEIEGLIKTSIDKVERGNVLMEQTADVLTEIVQNAQKTTDVINEIASSVREEFTAVDDIKTAIIQLNQVTQQNASLVEEIAGSSEALTSEAEDLSDLVSKFKIGMEV